MATAKIATDQNRVMNALLFQAEQEATQRTRNPVLRRDDPYLQDLRREQYQSIVESYSNRRDLTRGERQTLRFVRRQVRKMSARLNPTVLNRLRYWRPVEGGINWLRGRAATTAGYNRLIGRTDKQTTQEVNVNRLSEEMKKFGFTVSLDGPLNKAIAHNLPAFNLPYAAPGDANTDYMLFFKKLPGTDTYYLEKFDAATKLSVAETLRGDRQVLRHSFSLIEDTPFTAREAANLVHQFPVAKVVDGQEQWMTLNPTGQRELVFFDLDQALREHNITEMDNPARKDALINALQSGDRREVTIRNEYDQTQQVWVQVDPYAQGLLLKDKNNNLVDTNRLFHHNQNIEKMLEIAEDKSIVREMHHGMRG